MSLLAAAAVAAATGLAGPCDFPVGAPLVRHGHLAGFRAHPANMVDSVHRPGFNGRIWVSRPIVSDAYGHFPIAWPSPGPNHYGAYGNDCATAYAVVNHTVVSFSPWIRFRGETMKGYEAARRQWLREHGYTGGVRTFVSETAALPEEGQQASAVRKGLPEPRAVFQLAPDAPRAKNRLRVDATKGLKSTSSITATRVASSHRTPNGGIVRVSKAGEKGQGITKISKPLGGSVVTVKAGKTTIPSHTSPSMTQQMSMVAR